MSGAPPHTPPQGLVLTSSKRVAGITDDGMGGTQYALIGGQCLTGVIFIGHFKQKTTQDGDYILQHGDWSTTAYRDGDRSIGEESDQSETRSTNRRQNKPIGDEINPLGDKINQ